MPSVICVTFESPCRPLRNIGLHPITLLNILMPRYSKAHLNAKCHEVTLVMKLMTTNVTYRTPQNWVCDTITHVTLNIINCVHHLWYLVSLTLWNYARL